MAPMITVCISYAIQIERIVAGFCFYRMGGRVIAMGAPQVEFGRAVVMVTHDPRIAAYADRIIFLKDGKIADETILERKKK